MSPLEIIRYAIGGIVFILAIWIVIMNWASIFVNARNRRKDSDRNISMVPIMGGLLLPVSLFIMPLGLSSHIWFLSLIDASIFSIIFIFPMLLISINLKRR